MTEQILPDQARVETSDRFRCSSCGGGQVFDPQEQGLKCQQCGFVEVLPLADDEDIIEHDFTASREIDGREWFGESRAIHCDGCGAKTILEKFSIATNCSFCGSTHVVNIEGAPTIRPETLVPFKIDRRLATQSFRQWLGKKYFAPKAVHAEARPDHFRGVYMPYWTYDSDTETEYSGLAGKYYYVTEYYTVVHDGKPQRRSRQVRKIRWYPVSGVHQRYFDDLLVQADGHLDAGLVARIEPFNLQDLTAFRPEFLSGFAASSYSVSLQEGFERARAVMDREIEQGIRAQVSADELRLTHRQSRFFAIRYKHLLLPVWLSSFRYRDRQFHFMINGQTGKVHGNCPVSPLRVLSAILGGIAIAVILYVIINFLAGA